MAPINNLINLTRDLCEIPTGIVADGNEQFFQRIRDEIDLEIFSFPSNSEHNGWIIPHKWTVETATIHRDGKLIYDGTQNALGVAHYSRSFEGRMSLEDLLPHLYSLPSLPEAHVFHCTWLYRPWIEDWGLCPPHNLVKSLTPGNYDIRLKTLTDPGDMLVGHHHKQGKSEKTIFFQSNTCHPHMANDGLAGTAVMIRLFQWLTTQDTHYSYRLVLGPEHYGTIFYLRDHSRQEIDNYIGGVFGEMMGTDGDFVVASTFNGDEVLDRAFRHVVRNHTKAHRFVGFRESVGNDETVWEAPGIEIPCVQVNRFRTHSVPFPEYHTNFDNADLMDAEQLEEFLDVFKKVVELLEANVTMYRQFDGLVALSNPKNDIYLERFDPTKAAGSKASYSNSWGILQDSIPRYFDGRMSVLDIAEKHDIDFFDIRRYVQQFIDKGLVDARLEEIERPRVSHFDELD